MGANRIIFSDQRRGPVYRLFTRLRAASRRFPGKFWPSNPARSDQGLDGEKRIALSSSSPPRSALPLYARAISTRPELSKRQVVANRRGELPRQCQSTNPPDGIISLEGRHRLAIRSNSVDPGEQRGHTNFA